MTQTMDQARIAYALHVIEGWRKDSNSTEINSRLAALPAMIHMNGLGQAMAFYSHNDGSYKAIYDAISHWLCVHKDGRVINTDHKNLFNALAESNMFTYMAAQHEAQALLVWLKKLAKATLVTEGAST